MEFAALQHSSKIYCTLS